MGCETEEPNQGKLTEDCQQFLVKTKRLPINARDALYVVGMNQQTSQVC